MRIGISRKKHEPLQRCIENSNYWNSEGKRTGRYKLDIRPEALVDKFGVLPAKKSLLAKFLFFCDIGNEVIMILVDPEIRDYVTFKNDRKIDGKELENYLDGKRVIFEVKSTSRKIKILNWIVGSCSYKWIWIEAFDLDETYAFVKNVLKEERISETVERDLQIFHEEFFKEGGSTQRYVSFYERNHRIRVATILEHGVTCKGCGFNFEKKYGQRGYEFIEVHHLRPVSEIKEDISFINLKEDMTVVCSNCHAMIHREQNQVLSLEELHKIIEEAGKK